MTAGRASVGILPLPDGADPQPWWPMMLAKNQSTPDRGQAALRGGRYRPRAPIEALAVAQCPLEETGQDRSLLVVEASGGRPVACGRHHSGSRLSFSSTSVQEPVHRPLHDAGQDERLEPLQERRDEVDADGDEQDPVQLVVVDATGAREPVDDDVRRHAENTPGPMTRSPTLATASRTTTPILSPSTRSRSQRRNTNHGSSPTSRPGHPSRRATACARGDGRLRRSSLHTFAASRSLCSSLTRPPAPSATRRSRRTSGTC